ncbi:MAG: VCBS repeat-containing protein [Ignavibacteriae bacterium]|nr:VCBS repeat-containing protein [Ignavibacteriota bacterium]
MKHTIHFTLTAILFVICFLVEVDAQEYQPDANTVALDSGLVAYYPFNGNANDESGNGNNGTVFGAILTADRFGGANKAFSFNGVDHYILEQSTPIFNLGWSTYSITGWFNTSDISKTMQTIFNTYPHNGISISYNYFPQGKMNYSVGNGSAWDSAVVAGTKTNFQQNKWYFFSLIKNGNTYKFYIDGTLDISFIVSSSDYYNTNVGCRFGTIGGLWEMFKGKLDDFRIYNKALDIAEIDSLFHENGWDPQVKSVSPSQNALNISKSTNISATFNVAMNTATLNTSNILVHGSQSGKHAGTITLSGDTAITFNPTTDFKAGEIVNVTLTKNILSASGDSLTNGWHWQFSVATVSSPGTFSAKMDYTVGVRPRSIFASDVDNDGDADILTANYISASVSVMKNNGDGTFAPKADYPIDLPAFSVCVNDIDNDGDEDILLANFGGYVSVLKNYGDGTFENKVNYQTGNRPYFVITSDLDGDGDVDVVTANYNGNSVSILMNNGDGTFATKVDYPTGTAAICVLTSDIDNDGDNDLLVTNYTANTLSVLKNNGDGTFVSKIDYNISPFPISLFVNDIDADLDNDVLIANNNSGTFSVLKNNGDGTFANTINYSTGVTPSSIILNDIDGNGNSDVIVTNEDSYTISVLRNDDNGVFGAKVNYTTGASPKSVCASDVDNDGMVDLIVANYNAGTVSVFKNLHFGVISGIKFNDRYGNKTKDSTDGVLENWKIILSGTSNETTYTDANGNYTFTNLSPGSYTLTEEIKNGWLQTFPDSGFYTITLSDGDSLTGKDFWNFKYGSLNGMKFHDLNSNGIKDSADGILENWSIYLSGASSETTLTDANGNYSFDSLEAGTYIITEEERAGWVRTSDSVSYTITISSGDSVTNKNFGNYQLVSISGKKFHDVNADSAIAGEPGLSGWVIKLFKDCQLVARAVTDSSGSYSFNNLTAGTYTVEESLKVSWVQSYPRIGSPNVTTSTCGSGAGQRAYSLTISSGMNATGIDFANGQLGRICGVKYEDTNGNGTRDDGEPGLEGWTILLGGLTNAFTQTDAQGNYCFIGLSPGYYMLTEAQQGGWVKTEGGCSIFLQSGGSDTCNFGNFQFGSISGMKFQDLNGNGSKQPFEPYLSDWRFFLGKIGEPAPYRMRLTGGNGVFTFDSLLYGKYLLTEEQRAGWVQTTEPFDTLEILSGTTVTNIIFGNVFQSDCDVKEKWNMLSLPVRVVDSRKVFLFPSATSSAFAFEGSYQTKDSLENGVGYWLKFPADDSLSISGVAVETDSVEVGEGWNLIGMISSELTPGCVETRGTTEIVSQFFEFGGGYTASELLRPCKAYWVKVSQAGTLYFDGHCRASSRKMLKK